MKPSRELSRARNQGTDLAARTARAKAGGRTAAGRGFPARGRLEGDENKSTAAAAWNCARATKPSWPIGVVRRHQGRDLGESNVVIRRLRLITGPHSDSHAMPDRLFQGAAVLRRRRGRDRLRHRDQVVGLTATKITDAGTQRASRPIGMVLRARSSKSTTWQGGTARRASVYFLESDHVLARLGSRCPTSASRAS